MIGVVSFSGGKDSTAMLVKLLKDKIKIDEIIYIEDFFPYPEYIMQFYLNYIRQKLKINIIRLPLNYKDEVKKNKIYPSCRIRYCARLKAEMQYRYLKDKYGKEQPILFYIGTRKDESKRRNGFNKEGNWFWNKRFRVNWSYNYYIFDFTEEKVFEYLESNKIKLNPLYNILNTKRLGCSLCMNSTKTQKNNFYKMFPDDFNDFVEFEKIIKNLFPGKNITMFPNKSILQLKEEFENQKNLEYYINLNPDLKENPDLFPIIEEEMNKLSIEEKVDKFLKIIKIKMPDGFYDLSTSIKNQKLNELFPKFLYKLSITNKQILQYIAKEVRKNQALKFVQSILPELRKRSVELLNNPNIQNFLKKQREELEK